MRIDRSLNSDISSALKFLEHIQGKIQQSDIMLQTQTTDDIKLLLSLLENPVFRSIAKIEDSVRALNLNLRNNASIVPADFDITPSGELKLNIPPPVKTKHIPFDNTIVQPYKPLEYII